MTNDSDEVRRYTDLTDDLFCRPNSEYGENQFVQIGTPTVVVSGVMARVTLQRAGDESDRYELTLFEGIDGFAGDLWERSTKTLLRLRPLNHTGIPEIIAARYISARRIAFTLTRELGRPLDLDEAVRWAADRPVDAFEQFSILLDALRQLHGARVMHRGLLPGAFRTRSDSTGWHLSLARFEMSTLISNLIRRVVAGDTFEVRTVVCQIYLPPGDAEDAARHLAYLAPEMHGYIFDEEQRSRRDWDSTDIFGLGVLGWELFCGGLPNILPDELTGVATATGIGRVQALQKLHRAMKEHLRTKAPVPEALRSILLTMLDAQPDRRDTSFQLALRLEQEWDGIRSTWETAVDQPYLVAFMPTESIDTIYSQRRWISRSPEDAAGRDELRAFFDRELRQAFLVHSASGARGYATGPDDVLAEAEWVLVGERAVWFCAYLREHVGMDGRQGVVCEDALLIKYFREHETARELYEAQPRRRVPAIDLVAFKPDQSLAHVRKGRPTWRRLNESVKRRNQRDPLNEKWLKSLDFLLEYQRIELDARTYPFVLEDAGTGPTVLVRHDKNREHRWLHRSPLLTAFATMRHRRPALGDFLTELDDEGDAILVEVDSRLDQPGFTRDSMTAEFVARRDQDTVELRAFRGRTIPKCGWLRPARDRGDRPNLMRQIRARQALENQPGLVRALREPDSFHLSRQHWSLDTSDGKLLGNASMVIREMLTLQPFYALQGPPGSGKTHAVAHALRAFLAAEAGARVLVSAQSNFALDNLGDRLVKTLPKDLLVLRQAAEGRETENVRHDLQSYTLDNLTTQVVSDVERAMARHLGDDADIRGDMKEDGRFDDEPPLSKEERALAGEWRGLVRSNQIELSDRIRASANVVLATCSIAETIFNGATSLTENFDWVIVEEAAKAWPTEVIIPLVLGTRWTLVGDHRQLGAHRSDSVERFLDELQFHPNEEVRSHFDRMDDHLSVLNLFRSLFEQKENVVANYPSAARTRERKGLGKLTMQFRMHNDIAEPVRRVFYPLDPPVMDADGLPESFLETYDSTAPSHGVTAPTFLAGKALIWLDTSERSGCDEEPRWSNDGEVELIESVVNGMRPAPSPVAEDGDDDLVVLTPYRAQVKKLRRRGVLNGRVHTVHSFQGRESDRVIVSLVRTRTRGDEPALNVGHVGQDEVANVLLSRAKGLLLLVGNFRHFADNGGENWNMITRIVERYGKVVPADLWDRP
ncbi:MAG TPA: AAA domain-containing protein [Actinophytocola sp.]|jgi:hypothetical protein|nr:AAA domain-containing protein [Actinophytocola sp.]